MIDLSYYQDKVVLVAGASGFIGSHLTARLLELGARVVGLDNFITGRRENLAAALTHPNFTLETIDLNKAAEVNSLLTALAQRLGSLDALVHLASPASPPGYQAHPRETYLVNSLATHTLLTWLHEHSSATRFLFASSSEVYGDPQVHPQVESYWGNVNPNGQRSCYDESKRLGETICGVYGRDFGLDTRLVRIFNTYGPRMDLNDGRILPQFIKQFLAGDKLTVYGDGSQTRSYCYVTDLVAGLLLLLAGDNLGGTTVNLGNPGEFTVLQTAQIFNELAGRPRDDLRYEALPADDPLRRQPDIALARRLLGWEPKIEFRLGLKLMLESYQS